MPGIAKLSSMAVKARVDFKTRVCLLSALIQTRLVTTEEFIATNGATAFTTIQGFSPWRSLAIS
jgi:hypothetical protein